MRHIDLNDLKHRVSFDEHLIEMEEVVLQGPDNMMGYNETFRAYTELNLSRMKRWIKRFRFPIESLSKMEYPKLHLLVLTEGWCGDAAHILPIVHLIVSSDSQLEMSLIYRDEHEEIMDAFLTHGSRSIPKIILLDSSGTVLGSWGPRPQELQEQFLKLRAEGEYTRDEITLYMQKWYNSDKGHTTFRDVRTWIVSCL